MATFYKTEVPDYDNTGIQLAQQAQLQQANILQQGLAGIGNTLVDTAHKKAEKDRLAQARTDKLAQQEVTNQFKREDQLLAEGNRALVNERAEKELGFKEADRKADKVVKANTTAFNTAISQGMSPVEFARANPNNAYAQAQAASYTGKEKANKLNRYNTLNDKIQAYQLKQLESGSTGSTGASGKKDSAALASKILQGYSGVTKDNPELEIAIKKAVDRGVSTNATYTDITNEINNQFKTKDGGWFGSDELKADKKTISKMFSKYGTNTGSNTAGNKYLAGLIASRDALGVDLGFTKKQLNQATKALEKGAETAVKEDKLVKAAQNKVNSKPRSINELKGMLENSSETPLDTRIDELTTLIADSGTTIGERMLLEEQRDDLVAQGNAAVAKAELVKRSDEKSSRVNELTQIINSKNTNPLQKVQAQRQLKDLQENGLPQYRSLVGQWLSK